MAKKSLISEARHYLFTSLKNTQDEKKKKTLISQGDIFMTGDVILVDRSRGNC